MYRKRLILCRNFEDEPFCKTKIKKIVKQKGQPIISSRTIEVRIGSISLLATAPVFLPIRLGPLQPVKVSNPIKIGMPAFSCCPLAQIAERLHPPQFVLRVRGISLAYTAHTQAKLTCDTGRHSSYVFHSEPPTHSYPVFIQVQPGVSTRFHQDLYYSIKNDATYIAP